MQITLCRYTREDLALAKAELLGILRAANGPDAPLVTGGHCTYCRAKLICPAIAKEQEMILKLPEAKNLSVLTDEEVAMAREVTGRLKKRISEVEAESFRRAQENPELWQELGWEIKDGASKRTVEDVATVAERLEALGAPMKDITAACGISLKAVEALAREATKKKGMGLKKEVDGILDGCVIMKTSKQTLKRIGTEDEEE